MSEFQPGCRHRHAIARIPMRLASSRDEAPIIAEFHYTTREPYAVRATFQRTGHTAVEWTFARDLLLVGVARSAGIGDVTVCPRGSEVLLTLSSPEGTASLTAPIADMRRFTARMLHLVAVGQESSYLDISAELATLNPPISAGGES